MLVRKSPSGPNIALQSFPADDDAPNSGAAMTIDWSQGPLQRRTLTDTCQITSSGLPPGESVPAMRLELIQGAGGSKAVLFLSTKTPGGQGITLSTIAGSLDVVDLLWDGFTLFASVAGIEWGP